MITLYGIPNCDTVKKARVWLTENGHDYQFHDFKKQGVPEAALDVWLAALGWEKVLNKQGTTWKKLPDEVKASVVDAVVRGDTGPELLSRAAALNWDTTAPATVGKWQIAALTASGSGYSFSDTSVITPSVPSLPTNSLVKS